METLNFDQYFVGNMNTCQKRFDVIDNSSEESFYFYDCGMELNGDYVLVTFVTTASSLEACSA